MPLCVAVEMEQNIELKTPADCLARLAALPTKSKNLDVHTGQIKMNTIQTFLHFAITLFATLAERQKCLVRDLVRTLFTHHGMLPAALVAARFFTAPGIWWLGKNDFERLDFATFTRS